MNLSGHTQPFAVLGHPIGHTLSPVMHNASIASLGLDAIYLAFDVPPDRLMDVLPAMQAMGFGGVNLTVPLKEVAFAALSDLDDSARLLGAVNTVAFHETGMRGYNTDGEGFLRATEEAFGPCIAGATVFVVGTGGAGRAVALMCAQAGAADVLLSDIDDQRSERVAEEILEHTNGVAVRCIGAADQVEACRTADLVVQSTPVGMNPDDPALLPPEAFAPHQKAFDLIYMYPETPFLRAAKEGGAAIANGLGMLLHQGAKAFQIWTGQEPDVAAMRAALEEAVYGS